MKRKPKKPKKPKNKKTTNRKHYYFPKDTGQFNTDIVAALKRPGAISVEIYDHVDKKGQSYYTYEVVYEDKEIMDQIDKIRE